MRRQNDRRQESRRITLRSIWHTGLLLVSLAVFILMAVSVSRLLEARSEVSPGQEIKLKAEEKKEWSGSQLSPLHRIPLNDEFNQKIVPAAPNALPFSTRYSCEPCHSYSTISQGTHFNYKNRPAVDRRTEPWFLVDNRTGVQLPISFQKYPGFWSPEQLGLSDWRFVTLFARNLSGGGPGEPSDENQTPDSRWNVSGKLEINCLGCHHKSPLQDHSEWVKQVMRENFRWAATAASGLGEVVGMASRLPATWNIADGPNPDDREWAVVPQVRYNPNLFDSKNNAVLELPPPEDDRCLACHSVSPRTAKSRAEVDRDVHLQAGLKCVDCHRHDLSHEMVRGFEGEKLSRSNLQAQDFTCAGCHLGQKPEKGGKGFAGRLGAPRPAHKGIPKVHFERLACTVCHSGLLPEKEPQPIYTSRANRLGIFGKAVWTSEYPQLVEPVFVREADKKVYPERIMWPAFWAEIKDGELKPVDSQEILAAVPEIFNLKENVASLLNSLIPLAGEGFYPAVIISDCLFEPNVDGSLKARLLEKTPLAAKPGKGKFLLAQLKNGEVRPLLPEFDPDNPPAGVEDKVLSALQNLKPFANGRQPVFLIGKYIYRITEGYLDKAEKGGEPVSTPEICWLAGDEFQPFLSGFQVRNLAAIGSGPEILTEEQVTLALKKLSETKPDRKLAYVASGFVFSLDKNGKLKAGQHRAARAITWPLAHNVRPAQQALGKNGCTDCHSLNSRIFFGKIEASSPLKTSHRDSRLGADLMKTGPLFQFLFGFTFLVRPAFKLVLAACVLVMGLLLLAVIIRMTGRASGISGDSSGPESRS
ncbi:MAG: hypothetical protein N3G18_07455 [Candidatus Saccharicenans sp.]|nr:hypothetical protein [Candidatus Saccharicenans sp.]